MVAPSQPNATTPGASGHAPDDHTPPRIVSARARTYTTLVLALLMALLVIFATVVLATRMQLEATRHEAADRNVDRVLRTMQGELDYMDTRVRDWAEWDDTYDFMLTRSPAYADSNLTPEILSQIDMDLMIMIDAEGRAVWSRTSESLIGTEGPLPADVQGGIARSDLTHFSSPAGSRRGIVLIGSIPVLVSSHPVTTSRGEGPIRGTFLMGRALTADRVARLSELADAPLTLYALDATSLPDGIAQATRDPATGQRSTAEVGARLSLVGFGVLTDTSGQPIAYLGSPADPPDAVTTSRALSAIMAALFVVGIAWGGATLVLVERTSLSRVSWLRKEVTSIAASGTDTSRIPVDDPIAHDEIWAVAVDVNTMLESLEESRRAYDETQEFFAKASHELRTPLNSIIGFGTLLSKGLAGPLNDEQQRQADMILTSGKRLLALTNDLLEVEKLNANSVALELCDCDIDATVSKCADLVRPLVEEKGLELRLALGGVGTISADTRRIEQAILNLLSNAIKFTDSGYVSIETSSSADGVSVEVSDSGRGIDPQLLPHVFEEFISGTSRTIGTGLGLAITQHIAQRHGGRITVWSTEGVGSRFGLWLPVGPRSADGPHTGNPAPA